jgi:hypothetical protein
MIVIAQKEILALKLWLGKRAQCGARIERIAQRSAQGGKLINANKMTFPAGTFAMADKNNCGS